MTEEQVIFEASLDDRQNLLDWRPNSSQVFAGDERDAWA